MTRPNGPRSSSLALAQIVAFLLILLPGLGQHLTQAEGAVWVPWALLGATAVGMILAILLT